MIEKKDYRLSFEQCSYANKLKLKLVELFNQNKSRKKRIVHVCLPQFLLEAFACRISISGKNLKCDKTQKSGKCDKKNTREARSKASVFFIEDSPQNQIEK